MPYKEFIIYFYMKIIDCFLFYNELTMLKFRLEYLYDYVDKFVLLESTKTFVGHDKELYYEHNKHLFEKYEDKIIHIIVDDDVNFNPNDIEHHEIHWQREKFQRNCLDRGISQIDLNADDILIINDVDEIPDRNVLCLLRTQHMQNALLTLEQDFYYYNLNCKRNDKWNIAKIVNYNIYHDIYKRSCQRVRKEWRAPVVKQAGWHFSYFGDIEYIQNKIQNFSHQELNTQANTDANKIKDDILNCSDLFYKDEIKYVYIPIEENTYLPSGYEVLLQYCSLYKK